MRRDGSQQAQHSQGERRGGGGAVATTSIPALGLAAFGRRARMQCALIPAEDSRPLFAPLPVFYVWLGTRGLGGAGCCSCGGKVGPADAH